MKEPDFSRNPYKNVFHQIAKRRGVSRQAVRQGYLRNSPVYVMLVNNRIRAIDKMIEVKS